MPLSLISAIFLPLDVTPESKLMWLHLLVYKHQKKTLPVGLDGIAKEFGRKPSNTQKLIKNLVDGGLLNRKITPRSDFQRGRDKSVIELKHNLEDIYVDTSILALLDVSISNGQRLKELKITGARLLLWIVLLAKADEFGVVKNVPIRQICSITGTSITRLNQQLMHFRKNSMILSKVGGLKSSFLFGIQHSTYLLNLNFDTGIEAGSKHKISKCEKGCRVNYVDYFSNINSDISPAPFNFIASTRMSELNKINKNLNGLLAKNFELEILSIISEIINNHALLRIDRYHIMEQVEERFFYHINSKFEKKIESFISELTNYIINSFHTTNLKNEILSGTAIIDSNNENIRIFPADDVNGFYVTNEKKHSLNYASIKSY